MSDHDAAINDHFEAIVARCGGAHAALAVLGQEIARLRRIEAAAAAYRLTYEQQQEQRRTGVFTFRAADYNARNRVRAALFAALDEQH